MAFTRWVRSASEKQLIVAAQAKIAKKYGIDAPLVPKGRDLFWQRVYAPVFHRLPLTVRNKVTERMPGSHRRTWHQSPQAAGPAEVLKATPHP